MVARPGMSVSDETRILRGGRDLDIRKCSGKISESARGFDRGFREAVPEGNIEIISVEHVSASRQDPNGVFLA
uniref:Uncharacterized protein n=1 Tax=Candidatus Kentrum sp. LFY TaxID=2126342 RepID=A0A450UYL7_9GAMM|nr:MAG: hypothetical protein BECKLFY1418B_GA0070995_110413 [Candidatus Kentron sp. LFY]